MISKPVAVSLLLVVAVSGTPGCSSRTEATDSNQAAREGAAARTEAPALTVVPVISQPFERTLSLPGDLMAFQDVAIHAKVQGFIEWIGVDRGSVVQQGAVLARMVAPELNAQLLEAQAMLASERATFERLRQAAATPGVVAGNDVEVAELRVEAATARVEGLREIASYLQVTAPFGGVVTERSAHVGSLVGPSSGPIVRMQQMTPLRLVAAVPEVYVGGIAVGQPIRFTMTAFPGDTFTGRLARVARALDLKTRTMAVELDVANADGRLAPGMFADIRWPARRASPSLFVPGSAVATTTERMFVIRVRDGVVEWVDVTRGATMEDLVEVFGALQPGDEVAVRATDELRDGTRVSALRQTSP